MAKAKVIVESGFTYQGKPYAKGDEVTASAAQVEAWERIDYVKRVNETTKGAATKAATKGAAKSAATKGATKGKQEPNDTAVNESAAPTE